MKSKKLLFVFVLALMSISANAQKSYVWPPDAVSNCQRGTDLKGKAIELKITDVRLYTDVKDKCEKGEVISCITLFLKTAYPDAVFTPVLKLDPKNPGIEILINGYEASLKAAQWSARTAYTVRINVNNKTMDQSIEKQSNFVNLLGFATAKKQLQKTYLAAGVELLNFISQNLND